MRNHGRTGRGIRLVVAVAALGAIAAALVTSQPNANSTVQKVSSDVLQATEGGASTSFVIYLDDQADVSAAAAIEDEDARGRYVYETLKRHAAATQGPIKAKLDADGVKYTSYWAVNMIVADAGRGVVEDLADRSDVQAIESNAVTDGVEGDDEIEATDEGNEVAAIETGITNTRSPSLWTLGFKGQGIVVANQDTGMRWTHATLRTHYRGWGGSIAASTHDYNWWDGVHARITSADGGTNSPSNSICGYSTVAPCDDHGHGTHTTGTMVGDDAGAGVGTGTNQIGVAPEAKWIGCRNMDSGNGRASTYMECFQFFLAPTTVTGANPDPTKRPHVMNNSWGCPLVGELCARNVMKTIVETSEAAGIFVEASAGNDGPGCGTVQDPPGIYASTFSTGAISGSTNLLQSFSSRGAVTSDGSNRMKPDISAPGASVRSAQRSSDTTYGSSSGTSMAGPHVAGVVALLWSAKPRLVRDMPRTKYLLTRSANPAVTVSSTVSGNCGGIASVPNNHFGWGRVDALAAYNLEPSLNQTITFPPLAGRTWGDADFALDAVASSGRAVAYAASGNCTVAGGSVHLTGAGSCTITASQAGLDAYDIAATAPVPYYPAPDVVRTFAIAKASQTIAFGALADVAWNAPDFDVAASATSGLPVSFAASGPCTVSGATVHVTGVGDCTVTASQAGDADWEAAPSVSRTFRISWAFAGFFQPVDNGALNVAQPGSAIPVKFALGGSQGLAVLAAGYPRSVQVACPASTATDAIEQTSTAGQSGLSYDAATGQYVYVWKTEKAWAGTCRQLVVKLADNNEHRASFRFK